MRQRSMLPHFFYISGFFRENAEMHAVWMQGNHLACRECSRASAQAGRNFMDETILMNSFFSDGTRDYCDPPEPDTYERVTIRFRAAAGETDRVVLLTDGSAIPMLKKRSVGRFDYYATDIALTEQEFRYRFQIECGDQLYYYDKLGASKQDERRGEFSIVPGFSVPDWAKGAVMYQIMVDRFYNGNPDVGVVSDEYQYVGAHVTAVDNWYKYPANLDVNEFYGGDLTGVIQKLDYLKDLGIEAIYFNPLFVSPSSHKYDTQDYDYIDPHIAVIPSDGGSLLAEGETDNHKAERYRHRVTDRSNLELSNLLFAKLVREAHARGIRVIMDGVFNHCGSFHKWLDREGIYEGVSDYQPGAYHSADSPYHNYFKFFDENQFPDNPTYEGWWGYDTLPKLNYESSQELENYIINIGRKWVSPPYNADGWRLDVAADLGHSNEYNHQFWKKFRKAVKEANPEAVIIAEHYGDPYNWLQGDQWDTVMNYDAFMEPVSYFLTGMEKHSDAYDHNLYGNVEYLDAALQNGMARFHTNSLLCAMNQLSNHDHSRFLTRTNQKVGRAMNLGKEAASEDINKGIFKEGVVMQMTLPGAPTLYYGDEAGLCGFTDPDNRRTYPWGQEDHELLEFHRDIIRIHRENEALRTGSVRRLGGARHMIAYSRFNREQQFIIVLNNNTYSQTLDIDCWLSGVPDDAKLQQILYTQSDSHTVHQIPYVLNKGVLRITLPKYSAVILMHENAWDHNGDGR